jgi:exonuclease SbcC
VRPLSLTIEGLTSFKTIQEIDLSKLDLFVITGPTGSGKSTILDAITFALYGSIPRVNSHELRDLISHGSSYMRVCLDFQVDGTHYRAARRMGRNSHQATLERVMDDSTVTEVEHGGIRAVNDRLEQIVGLDYRGFTKAVLLPQGAFHEFLKGEVGERRRILTRLLDLGRYETAGQAARREATRLDAIIGERVSLIESNYQDATKERLDELKTTLDVARERHSKVEKAKRESYEIASAAAKAVQQIEALSGNTSQIESILGDLKRLADGWPPLDAEDRAAQLESERTAKALDVALKGLEQARTALAGAVKSTGDASLLARLEDAAMAHKREQGEVAKLESQLAEARKEAKELAKVLQASEKAETKVGEALKAAVVTRETARAQHVTAATILRCAEASAKLSKLDEELAPAKEEAAKARGPVQEARKKLRHLEQEHAAVALRVGLGPGDHCPVCDSVIATVPESDAQIEALLAQTREALQTAEMGEQSRKDAVVALQTRQRDAIEELKQARAVLVKGAEVPDIQEATAALARAEGALTEAHEAESTSQGLLSAAVQASSEAKTAVTKAETQADGIATNREGAEERLQAAFSTLVAGFGPKLPEDLQAEITHRRDELAAAEKVFEDASAETDVARQARDQAHDIRAECSGRVSAFDQEFATVRTAARMTCESVVRVLENKTLPAVPAEDPERAKLLIAWRACCDAHVVATRKAEKDLSNDVRATATKLERLAAKVDVPLASEKPLDMAAEFEAAAVATHGVVVASEKDIETQQTRIGEREKLELGIVNDRQLCALYATLARELRADHFIAFVLAESMNQLAAQASEELLQISDNRYSLVAEEGSFEVIDHHNADERRSVATLSGGETFLASLSLALALSVGLRELAGVSAGRLEAIFIDEGFGALDPDTLDVVVDALERLREGERMVGVITHVPTLADRIPAGLIVETNGGSSQIVAR